MYAISSLSKLYVEPEDRRELRKTEKKSKGATQLHNTVQLYSAACYHMFVQL